MAGDPKECRRHALQCSALAKRAASAEARQVFLDLARDWNKLAADLDDAQDFLAALVEIEDAMETESPPSPHDGAAIGPGG